MNNLLDLKALAFSCGLSCFELIEALAAEPRQEELIRLACRCGSACLAVHQACQFGTVLPEAMANCRRVCAELHDACESLEHSHVAVDHCMAACSKCAAAADAGHH